MRKPCVQGRGARHLIHDIRKATQHAGIESYNGKFRVERLNGQWLQTLHQARQVASPWQRDCNEARPNGAIGRTTPAQLAAVHRRGSG